MTLLPGDIDKIATFELFQGLSKDVIEKVIFGANLKELKHREHVFRAGDLANSFCVVVDGAVKLFRHSPRGEDIIMHFAVQGDVVGALLMNQSENATFPISAKSMGPTRVICIPKSTFKKHWQTDGVMQSRLNALLYRRMSNIQDDKMMSTSPLRVRIANLLMRHLDQYSGVTDQSLTLSLTRQEIADALGVAVESVIRSMRDWQDDGTLYRPSEKSSEVINIQKLLRNLNP